MSEWQPIETAPRDGRTILAWGALTGVWIVFWNQRISSWDDGDYHDNVSQLTHWTRIPEPPK